MAELFSAKLRRIGTSIGVIVPNEQLKELNVKVGDEIEVGLLKHRKQKDIERGFGLAKDFKEPFKRDKKTREF